MPTEVFETNGFSGFALQGILQNITNRISDVTDIQKKLAVALELVAQEMDKATRLHNLAITYMGIAIIIALSCLVIAYRMWVRYLEVTKSEEISEDSEMSAGEEEAETDDGERKAEEGLIFPLDTYL